MKNSSINTLLFILFFVCNTQAQEKTPVIKKYQFISAINLGFNSDFSSLNTGATVTNGLLVKNRYSVSFGTGLEGSLMGANMPLYLEGKYYLFNKKKHTPFISMMSGYLQPIQNNGYNYSDRRGGFVAGAQIGYQNFFSEHVGISTSIGYRYSYQKSNNYNYFDIYYLPYPNWQFKEVHIANRLELRLTFLFK